MIWHPVRASAAVFALITLGACGVSKPESVRPAPVASAPPPVVTAAATPDIPVPPQPDLILSQDACHSDADCIPATCCHAAACMSVEKAKPCTLMCTQVCMPGTIDCGGACLCHRGHCAARPGNGGK
jgi:hypothetical protein